MMHMGITSLRPIAARVHHHFHRHRTCYLGLSPLQSHQLRPRVARRRDLRRGNVLYMVRIVHGHPLAVGYQYESKSQRRFYPWPIFILACRGKGRHLCPIRKAFDWAYLSSRVLVPSHDRSSQDQDQDQSASQSNLAPERAVSCLHRVEARSKA